MSKIELNTDSIILLINMVCDQIREERDLALDRFRRQDETIDGPDAFYVQGKIMAEYLRIAAACTDALNNLTKLVTSIVFKGEMANGTPLTSDMDLKKEILKQLEGINLSSEINLDMPGTDSKK